MDCFPLNYKTAPGFRNGIRNARLPLILEDNPLSYEPLIAGVNYFVQKNNAPIYSSECAKEWLLERWQVNLMK